MFTKLKSNMANSKIMDKIAGLSDRQLMAVSFGAAAPFGVGAYMMQGGNKPSPSQ